MIFIILFFKLFERSERYGLYDIHFVFARSIFIQRIEIHVYKRP